MQLPFCVKLYYVITVYSVYGEINNDDDEDSLTVTRVYWNTVSHVAFIGIPRNPVLVTLQHVIVSSHWM